MDDRHLDSLELDAVRAGEADVAATAHVASCPACRSEADHLCRLAGLLKDPVVEIPAAVDRAILARFRKLGRRPIWTAAAAAAAVACLGWLAVRPQTSPLDVDRSGRVDIRDAYLLALEIRAGGGRDADGDGLITPKDAEAIARKSVSLERRP